MLIPAEGEQDVAANPWIDNLLRASETCAVPAAYKKKGKRMRDMVNIRYILKARKANFEGAHTVRCTVAR